MIKLYKIFVFFLICCCFPVLEQTRAQILHSSLKTSTSLLPLPPTYLGAPAQPISGEHISMEFYKAVECADKTKRHLQSTLYNFLENLQRNLTTSVILNTNANRIDNTYFDMQRIKINDLLIFFNASSQAAADLANDVEHLYEITKNESNALWQKIRHLPKAQGRLPLDVKSQLTDYFEEMEFFHIVFSEIIDQALEYIVDTMRLMQRSFSRYSDIQHDVLYDWKLSNQHSCYNQYMHFLQKWSVEIFQCAAGHQLDVAYDVYAMTDVITSYILRQLEFRIQRLFNCFLFGKYEIRCRFLKHPEKDFKKLHSKLDELQFYYDIKIKHGKVPLSRQRKRRNEVQGYNEDLNEVEKFSGDKCIPYGFPESQMFNSFKSCFHVLDEKVTDQENKL